MENVKGDQPKIEEKKNDSSVNDTNKQVGKTSNKMKFVAAGILATIALAAAAYKFGALKGMITK